MRSVRNEVINMVVNHLVIVFGGVGCPSKEKLNCWNTYFNSFSELAVMREIVTVMGFNYPNLFQEISCQGNLTRQLFVRSSWRGIGK